MGVIFRQWFRSASYGVISLLMVNGAAAFTGVSLGFGWLACGVPLTLGVPGVVGLLILNALCLI